MYFGSNAIVATSAPASAPQAQVNKTIAAAPKDNKAHPVAAKNAKDNKATAKHQPAPKTDAKKDATKSAPSQAPPRLGKRQTKSAYGPGAVTPKTTYATTSANEICILPATRIAAIEDLVRTKLGLKKSLLFFRDTKTGYTASNTKLAADLLKCKDSSAEKPCGSIFRMRDMTDSDRLETVFGGNSTKSYGPRQLLVVEGEAIVSAPASAPTQPKPTSSVKATDSPASPTTTARAVNATAAPASAPKTAATSTQQQVKAADLMDVPCSDKTVRVLFKTKYAPNNTDIKCFGKNATIDAFVDFVAGKAEVKPASMKFFVGTNRAASFDMLVKSCLAAKPDANVCGEKKVIVPFAVYQKQKGALISVLPQVDRTVIVLVSDSTATATVKPAVNKTETKPVAPAAQNATKPAAQNATLPAAQNATKPAGPQAPSADKDKKQAPAQAGNAKDDGKPKAVKPQAQTPAPAADKDKKQAPAQQKPEQPKQGAKTEDVKVAPAQAPTKPASDAKPKRLRRRTVRFM